MSQKQPETWRVGDVDVPVWTRFVFERPPDRRVYTGRRFDVRGLHAMRKSNGYGGLLVLVFEKMTWVRSSMLWDLSNASRDAPQSPLRSLVWVRGHVHQVTGMRENIYSSWIALYDDRARLLAEVATLRDRLAALEVS